MVPFVVQIFAAVGITGYLSFRNGQKAVRNLATQLEQEVSERVSLHLDNYLSAAVKLTQVNVDAIELGFLALHDYKAAGHFFWKQLRTFEKVGYLSYTLPTGEFVGAGRWLEDGTLVIDETSTETNWKTYSFATDSEGNRTEIISNVPYDPFAESWYQQTVEAGKPIWTDVYAWDAFPDIFSIPFNYPLYDENQNLTIILGIDLLLTGITDFLHQIKLSPSSNVFVLERDGALIASSSSELPYKTVNGEAKRLNITESGNSAVQATAQRIQEQFGGFEQIGTEQQLEFIHDSERYFVRVTPWQDKFGLDWLVVVTVPESDFMAQINANTRNTILLCLAALLLAVLCGLVTSRWITRPIHRLSGVAQAIADGDLSQRVEIQQIAELGVLSQAFNRMVQQLQSSFTALDATNQELEKTNLELEQRVEQRTAQLQYAKDAAEVANRAKSEFLANMSHELRTPLNAILGFTQIMRRDSALNRKQRENLGIIDRSGEHLLSLINDVLDLSKIEAGSLHLHRSNIDLYEMLDTIQEMFALKAETKGLQLIGKRRPDVPRYIEADAKKLRQVLINLLSNAIKFTEEGSVFLRVKSTGADFPSQNAPNVRLLFEVEDTGAGIAPEELDSLFTAFVQTETGRNSQQGTGLGLPISRKFVQLMGGEIDVRSTVGVGTTFSFEIPVQKAIAASPPVSVPRRRVVGLAPNQPPYRILVVDDRWENRQIMLQLLEPVGFEVKEAANGQEAVVLWQEWAPHLIWLDMRMPVMNGYEAASEIKFHLQGQATVIIALTASTFEEERGLVLSAGCDDFVRKPFRETTIWHKITEHLGVQYLYEENPAVVDNPSRQLPLEPAMLNFMSQEWLERLAEAAALLDGEAIAQLLQEIPQERVELTNALQQRVNDFDFDYILSLLQQVPV
ncbi:MAG: ATP-binding protein [Cyanophyceae cyanobacterium]